jgi:hypothetical protein
MERGLGSRFAEITGRGVIGGLARERLASRKQICGISCKAIVVNAWERNGEKNACLLLSCLHPFSVLQKNDNNCEKLPPCMKSMDCINRVLKWSAVRDIVAMRYDLIHLHNNSAFNLRHAQVTRQSWSVTFNGHVGQNMHAHGQNGTLQPTASVHKWTTFNSDHFERLWAGASSLHYIC